MLSDVHANRPALEAVLRFLKGLGVSEGLVIGDLVGYGPHPVECVELLQDSEFLCLKGNHDVAVAHPGREGAAVRAAMSMHARWTAEWTTRRMPAQQRAWLLDLPRIVYRHEWMAVHGAPIDPRHYSGYVHNLTCKSNLDELERQHVSLCFHGHTHVPGIHGRVAGRADAHYTHQRQDLARFRHALICAGAVSQPRNGQTGAQVAVYDGDAHSIDFHTLPYDASATVSDMRRLGFPEALAQRLQAGA